MASFRDLRAGTLVNRNRDMNWTRMLDKASAAPHRRVAAAGKPRFADADRRGNNAATGESRARQSARTPPDETTLRGHLGKWHTPLPHGNFAGSYIVLGASSSTRCAAMQSPR
jgi:putative protease